MATMKAYKAWDERAFDPCSTIVFVESIKEAKKNSNVNRYL